jgi:formylglycine-generating enzyme required for sulfatase activity
MLKLPGGVSLKMALIPPGSFWMGSPEGQGSDHEHPRHRVTLTQGFYLGVCPVTQSQWQAVMGSNPSRFKGEHRPVEMVSWDDCQKFCEELGKKTGKRYRLPSEAEWEYACRAGTLTEYHTGDGVEALKRAGWCSYDGNYGSAKETKPVGQFERNAWGLFDMHGNVWEWCLDDMRKYTKEDYTDRIDRTTGRVARVLRGGSWDSIPSRCRAAYRLRFGPGIANVNIGLRVVLCLD